MLVPKVLMAVSPILASQGLGRIQVEVVNTPSNIIDGKATFRISASAPEGELSWDMELDLVRGMPVLTEQRVLDELAKVRAAEASRPVDLGMEVSSMRVDFGKVEARRNGDLIIYSSPELPQWNFPVSFSELKTDDGKKKVLAELVESINNYCLSDFGVKANVQAASKLPVVQVNEVKASAKPKPIPELMAETVELNTNEFVDSIGTRKVHSAQSYTPQEFRAAEFRNSFEASLRQKATPTLVAWARSQGGGAVEVISWDLSKAEDHGSGAKGKIVATLRFYTDTSREEVEVEASLKPDGTVDATTISKTESQVKFEAERNKELQIKSEEEAKLELERFLAEQKRQANTEAFINAALGFEATGQNVAQGQNFLNKPVADRIPILKALLPKDAAEPGKFIELNGYVYELRPTNYNSVSEESSAYLMACLTDKLPGKYPNMGMWGSMSSIFSRV
jgi:hypothetical protein